VADGELGGDAMAGIGLPSPEFFARATPGTNGDGTNTGSKREAWRTHLAGLERRKSAKEGVRLPKAAADLLCTAARQRKPSKRKSKGERVGRLRINDPHPSVTYGGGQFDGFVASTSAMAELGLRHHCEIDSGRGSRLWICGEAMRALLLFKGGSACGPSQVRRWGGIELLRSVRLGHAREEEDDGDADKRPQGGSDTERGEGRAASAG
jgi:hypothetical protein